MGATKGNNFYLKRASSGRDKIFSSPEELFNAACEYFEHVDANPWLINESIKSGDLAGTTMSVDTKRPYTLSGLCVFIGCTQQTLTNYGTKEEYKDFFAVVEEIKSIVYTQKFEGAAVGAFNSNIIARDLGLKDSQDHSSTDGTMTPPQTIKLEYKGKDINLRDD